MNLEIVVNVMWALIIFRTAEWIGRLIGDLIIDWIKAGDRS